MHELEKELGEPSFSDRDYVSIEYINYKNKHNFNYYLLELKGIHVIDKEEIRYLDAIYISDGTMNAKETAELIRMKSEPEN